MLDFEKRVAEAKREIRARSFDGIQRRSAPFTVELRDAPDGGYVIGGHGAVYNSLSDNLGGFREQIMPGAFAPVLNKQPDVRALFNHDPNLVLAGTRNGTLGLSEDAAGLAYEARVSPSIASTYYGGSLKAMLGDGLVTQSSFAFRVAAGGDSWDEDPDSGALIRTIREFSGLYDVSPVTYPAYPAADSGLRAVRMDVPSVGVLAKMIALGTEFVGDESSDPDDISAMEALISSLNDLLQGEITEESSAQPAERNGDGPSAGERADSGDGEDAQADDAPWRLKAVQRRMALRVAA